MPTRRSITPPSGHPAPELLRRGAWRAPWLGPSGEIVLIAITHAHRLYGEPVIVPNGADEDAVIRRLTGELNRADPIPPMKII